MLEEMKPSCCKIPPGKKLGFLLYPTQIEDIIRVSDSGEVMSKIHVV